MTEDLEESTKVHSQAIWLIKFDFTNCFMPILKLQAFKLLKSLDYQSLVAFEFSRLCARMHINLSRADGESGNDGPRTLNSQAQILFTRGEHGMTLHTPDSQLHQPAIAVDVADTVGAGEACMASWLAAELLGIAGLRERLRFPAVCASIPCRHAGAHAPALADVKVFPNTSEN